MRTVKLSGLTIPGGIRDRITPRTLVALGFLWLGVFFVAPVAYLLVQSLNFGDGHVLAHYDRVFSRVYLEALGRTYWYALITTILTLFLGYLTAYYIAFKSTRPILLLTLVLLPLWVAIIIRFFGVRLFFLGSGPVQLLFGTDFGILNSRNGVIVGLISALLPFAVLPIYNSLRSIDEEIIHASKTLGAGPFQTLRSVIFPLSLSGVVAATLFVFILAAGSFLAPAIMGGPGNFMMANVIEDAQGYSRAFAAALAVVFTVTLLVVIGIFNHVANVGEVLGDL